MKKGLIVLVAMILLLMISTSAVAQEGTVNVGISIESDNTNVGITSGDYSTYGIYSGIESKFYINGQDLGSMFNQVNGTSQFGSQPAGAFTQQGAQLPMPPAPAQQAAQGGVAGVTVVGTNYDNEIQELYEIAELAYQEREVLADALVKAIDIIEGLEDGYDQLLASSLVIDPEPPAVSPDELSTEEAISMLSSEIASLKMRLLINDIITLVLLVGSILMLIRYRNSLFGAGSGREESISA